jgi:hypothetical protein
LIYLIFSLSVYAMSSIVVEQKIFEDVRNWIKTCNTKTSWFSKKLCQLISCMFCTGFWSGVILNILGFNVFNINIFDPFFSGLYGAISSWSFHLLYSVLENKVSEAGIDL